MKPPVSNPVDLINMKLEQLTALLSVGMCEEFTIYDHKTQNSYLWACSSLAEEIKASFQQLDEKGRVQA